MARIVNQVTNKGHMDVDQEIDEETANFLKENYSGSAQSTRKKIAVNNEWIDYEPTTNWTLESAKVLQRHPDIELDKVNSWGFDVFNYSNVDLIKICMYFFDYFHLFKEFSITENKMTAFLLKISACYQENPYHNFKRAVDTTHAVYRMIAISDLNRHVLHSLEIFSVLLASISHDVGHPGVQNSFLVKVRDDLALRYNDR